MGKDNLKFYNLLRTVPNEAKKEIGAGRLKGMSDINPVWRIKTMTEAFGVCGIGWKYEIVRQWQETYGQEVKAFTNINLFVRVDGEWSDPIPGTGGATLVEVNSKGQYVNDEGFKMSLTDALSVAMKSLGVAADVYFAKDATKYAMQQSAPQPTQQEQLPQITDSDTAKIAIGQCHSEADLLKVYNMCDTALRSKIKQEFTKRRVELQKGGSK